MSRLTPVTSYAFARILQAQLVQRADAVGVAVEDVIELHEFYSPHHYK